MADQITRELVTGVHASLVRQARESAPHRLAPEFDTWLEGYSEGIEHACDTLQMRLAPQNEAAAVELATLRRLVEAFTDPDPCRFDHDGSCQAHDMALEPNEMCPHAEAQHYLAVLEIQARERTAAALAAAAPPAPEGVLTVEVIAIEGAP